MIDIRSVHRYNMTYPQADEVIMEPILSGRREMEIYEIPASATQSNGKKIRMVIEVLGAIFWFYSFLKSVK